MNWWTEDAADAVMSSIVQWFRNQIAEIADSITIDFLSDFKPNIEYFNEIFPTAQSYYEPFATIGIILAVAIFLLSCLFMLWGIVTGYEENLLQMVGRLFLSLFAVVYAGHIMNYIYAIGNSIADILSSVERDIVWGDTVSLLGFLEVDTVSAVLQLVLTIIIVWNLIQLFLEIMERYLVMCFFWYMAPLANATLTSKATSKIFTTFYSAAIVQVLICALNVWFLRLTTDVCISEFTSDGSITDTLMHGLLIIAWLTVAKRVDQYLKSIGLSTVQTGGSIGRAVWGTVSTISSVVSMGGKAAKALGANDVSNGATGYKDVQGKTYNTVGNKEIANAAHKTGGVMSKAEHLGRNQNADAFMATNERGKSVATIVGEAGRKIAFNSNIPGINSPSVVKDSVTAGAPEGEQFRFSYNTMDGSAVSGHVSRLPEENGRKGIRSVGSAGVQYTYFDKGSGLSTGTGVSNGETKTVFDANIATAAAGADGKVDISTGAWNKKVFEAVGMNGVEMDSHMTMDEHGKIIMEDKFGTRQGTIITSDHKAFDAAKTIGNYYQDTTTGNQYVGIPESNLDGLNLDPERVAEYINVKNILGENYVPKGEQTLETDGVQNYVSTKDDGSVVHHRFVTADNLDYSKLDSYRKVQLPNQGTVYHRARTYGEMHSEKKDKPVSNSTPGKGEMGRRDTSNDEKPSKEVFAYGGASQRQEGYFPHSSRVSPDVELSDIQSSARAERMGRSSQNQQPVPEKRQVPMGGFSEGYGQNLEKTHSQAMGAAVEQSAYGNSETVKTRRQKKEKKNARRKQW